MIKHILCLCLLVVLAQTNDKKRPDYVKITKKEMLRMVERQTGAYFPEVADYAWVSIKGDVPAKPENDTHKLHITQITIDYAYLIPKESKK